MRAAWTVLIGTPVPLRYAATPSSPEALMSLPLTQMAAQLAALSPEARAAAINAFSGGLDDHVGLAFTWCAEDRVEATVTAEARHTQVYGLVHGGLYCTMVEAVGSCGAALLHLPRGRLPVGVENRTRFLKAARAGTVLTATGIPTEVTEHGSIWSVKVTSSDGTLCADGQLTARALPPGKQVGGEALSMPDGTS